MKFRRPSGAPASATTAGAPLVCPSCRRPPDSWPLTVGSQSPPSFTCANPSCDVEYPVLPGTSIPLVVRGGRDPYEDFDAGVRFDERASVEGWIGQLERGGDQWEQAIRAGMHAALHHGRTESILTRLHRRFVAALAGEVRSVADLGCGVGGFTRLLAEGADRSVVGLDSWGLALRVADAASLGGEVYVPVLSADADLTAVAIQPIHGGRTPVDITWVAADVLDPPLPAASFDLVTAINLFDTVSDPALAIGQASALLRPGGHLLVAQPDAVSATTTPPGRWLPSRGPSWESVLAHYGLETVDEDDGFDWTLHRGARTSFRYTSHASLLRRGP